MTRTIDVTVSPTLAEPRNAPGMREEWRGLRVNSSDDSALAKRISPSGTPHVKFHGGVVVAYPVRCTG